MVGQSGELPIQVFADQLTRVQPEGLDCPPTLLLAHSALGTL